MLIFSKKEEISLELRQEFEDDLKLQLKRQSAAHALHLAEELQVQSEIQSAAAQFKLDSEIKGLTDDYVSKINAGISFQLYISDIVGQQTFLPRIFLPRFLYHFCVKKFCGN